MLVNVLKLGSKFRWELVMTKKCFLKKQHNLFLPKCMHMHTVAGLAHHTSLGRGDARQTGSWHVAGA